VVVVAGLSGLNQPLESGWVHRPEAFALLSGLQQGDLISPQALQRVLAHHEGGLKGIPRAARRVALLNQADNPMLQSQGGQLARSLLGEYSSVLVAALTSPESSDDPVPPGVHAVFEPVAGVVLAAGGASRLGQPKQLLLWKGEPLVRHAAQAALQAGLSPVIVVTGAYGDRVNNVLNDLPVLLVHNPNWQAGQSTSMLAGLSALPPDAGAVVFMLADQPQVPADLVRELAAYHSRTLAPIIAPIVDGQRGNPVLFDRNTFPALSKVEGDMGGRAVFSRFPVTWLPWHDASLLLDIDQPEDYQALLELPVA
jgi:molybdenum cofactor cytidylyltransferase